MTGASDPRDGGTPPPPIPRDGGNGAARRGAGGAAPAVVSSPDGCDLGARAAPSRGRGSAAAADPAPRAGEGARPPGPTVGRGNASTPRDGGLGASRRGVGGAQRPDRAPSGGSSPGARAAPPRGEPAPDTAAPGALDGLVVLDLSRILAGPTCTQMLADLGAEVLKIENPATRGDDTRQWGPPFAEGPDGPSDLSAYFMSANRNKRSVAVDIATPQGQGIVRRLAARADVVVENFRTGGLARYGLDAETMTEAHPHLVWCSISGFGRTGPNAAKPGYDLLAQGYGGIMSLTGEPGGRPMKVGVGIADVVCGLQAAIGILAALRHRDRTGEGQVIDLGLVDSQMSWLINVGTSYLTSGAEPRRDGNAHPSIVPYQVFATADGHVIVAVGNDGQFARFCDFLGEPGWAEDPRFATNPARLANRAALIPMVEAAMARHPTGEVVDGLEARRVSVGPVNTVPQALTSEQAVARGMVVEVPTPAAAAGHVRLLGNPLHLSRTPVRYRRAPPAFGADTDEVLGDGADDAAG